MSTFEMRWTGALADHARALLASRTSAAAAADPRAERVRALLADVRERGDAALRQQVLDFDRVRLDSLEVPRQRWRHALRELPPDLRGALERMVRHLWTAHSAQMPGEVECEVTPGVRVGRRPEPLARLGVYAPGGRAAYPSSVLMAVVPARVAGVREVVVCSPAQSAGEPSSLVLAAAELAGADRVFALGGAGAVAAMAYGTESVPAVDRVVGPGNAWVAEAKRQLAGLVPIDAPAGPSEVLVVADAASDPDVVARELLAQAEHDPEAVAVAVLVGLAPERVEAALAARLACAPRAEAARAAFAAQGALLATDSLDAALDFAGDFAAEHLALLVAEPRVAFARVRTTGAAFLGAASAVVFGDYLTGGNHVLPTGGAARAWSGLSVNECLRWTSWAELTPAGAASLAADTALLAESEGLPAHAEAARAWGGA